MQNSDQYFVCFISASLKPIAQLPLYGAYHMCLFSSLPLSDLFMIWFLTLPSLYLDHDFFFKLISFS